MSNYPNNLDDDITLPIVNDNLTEIGGDAINALRDAVFNIEQALGVKIAGTSTSLAARLGVFINPDGSPNTSVLTSLGLVTLPITNNQIANNAGIPESKLQLDFRTQDLFNYIRDLSKDINVALGWINVSGVKLEPHLLGVIYRHDLGQIDVISTPAQFLNNKFRVLRDNSTAYNLINDMNNELLAHQWADGSPFGIIQNIITNNSSVYPSNYAHTASGIFLNSSTFATIPQTIQDVQSFANFIDSASIFLFGTRIQNLYSNGISRNSRSSQLNQDGYGQSIIPFTPATTYLSGVGSPLDDISTGDDIIKFNPSANDGYAFDEKFSLVKVGDIIRVNYGNIIIPFIIKEKKYSSQNGVRIATVRIAGKNILATTTASARIDKPLWNNNKFGVLSTASANDPYTNSLTPSLIVGSPRGAQALGSGFNPDQLDSTHYLLYLALYPTGNPLDGYTILPAIDVTGNAGITPGSYTLDGVVQTVNDAFRKPGFNYRFIAFQYNGQFGIMLADSYGNAGFSIINGVVNANGVFDTFTTSINFANNVVGVFPYNLTGTFTLNNGSSSVATSVSQVNIVLPGDVITFSSQTGTNYVVLTVSSSTIVLTTSYTGTNSISSTANLPNDSSIPDPLGFGFGGANIASPPFLTSYSSAQAAQNPTKLFVPLKRNTYYINGAEREKLTLDVGQALDTFGDGYWLATIDGYNVIPGSRVEVTYKIPLNLSTSLLKAGKTLVVQPLTPTQSLTNYGRFIIKSVTVECSTITDTKITVWDAVHGTGISPSAIAPIGTQVALYFNSDSVTFNTENSTDITGITPFKRYFEVYIDQNGNTYTHERGRFFIGNNSSNVNGVTMSTDPNLAHINFIEISPKLRGYQFGSVNKISLMFQMYDSATGQYIAQLVRYDGTTISNMGPLTYGKRGQITTFYDETNVDFIKMIFDLNISEIIGSVGSNVSLDIQLFPTLSLDEETMLVSSCQLNDTGNIVNHVTDRRQFGNISEEQLSSSALDFIAAPIKRLRGNGVIRGFDLETDSPGFVNPINGQIFLTGGEVLVNGKLIQMSSETVTIPLVQETFSSTLYNINWILCVNDKGEYQPIVLLDFDPVLGTPNTGTSSQRQVTLFNVVNGNTYFTDAITFADLNNRRKDLVPIYLVAATVATPANTISLNVSDVRRFVTDIDSNLPLKLALSNSSGDKQTIGQGNFKTPTAIFNWIKYNNSFNGTAIIKGAGTDITAGVISSPLTLDFGNAVVIDGQNSAVLTMNAPIGLGSNLTLKNMTINFNGASTGTVPSVFAAPNISNLTIDNCIFNITINSGQPPTNNLIFNFFNGNNIKIINSTITVNYNSLLTQPVTLSDITAYSDVFRLNQTNGFLLDNTQIQANYILNPGVNVPGNIMTVLSSSNVRVSNSGFSGNFHRGIAINKSTATHIFNTSFSSKYCPYANSANAPDFGFNINFTPFTTNPSYVNTGSGYIYISVDTNLEDIIIDDCNFSFTPVSSFTDGYQTNRFSFINIELTTAQSILKNLKITSNRFNGNQASSVFDQRPAIAIINTSTTPATLTSQNLGSNSGQPILQNANISNNFCNSEQSIIITSKTYNLGDGYFNMYYPGLAAIGCNISDNICGYIGYWISSGSKSINIPPGVNSLSSKMTGLLIDGNICHDITNMDHNGLYFIVSAVQGGVGAIHNYSKYPSGNVIIRDNKTNWIHTGIAFEENSSLAILNNVLNAYDITILSNIADSVFQTSYGGSDAVSSGYAIFVSSNSHQFSPSQNPGESNNSLVEIAGNITSTGYHLSFSSGLVTTYKYGGGYIFSQPSANIHHNTLKGTDQNGGVLIITSGTTSYVTHNRIYRQGNGIISYVGFPRSNWDGTVVWGGDPGGLGANTTGIITDNFFDSPFIDAANTINTTYTLPTAILTPTPPAITPIWRIERNKNQTSTVTVFPAAGQIGLYASGASDPVVAGKVGTNSFVSARTTIVFAYNDTTVNQFADWLVPLSAVIPANCTLISASVSIVASTAISTASYNTTTMYFTDGPGGFPQSNRLSAATSISLTNSSQSLTNSAPSWSTSILDPNRGGFITIEMGITNASATTITCSPMTIVYRW